MSDQVGNQNVDFLMTQLMSVSYASGPKIDPPVGAHSFLEIFSSSAVSRRASCQLLAKEWVLNTGKLPSIG